MSKTERELLKEEADSLGLQYPGNIATAALQALVDRTKSGEDEVIELDEDKEGATAEDPIQAARAKLTALVRCMVTCNDPAMKDWDMTPYYSFSNSILDLPKITVPLNVEWHIPRAYFDWMASMECKISVKGKDEKNRPITVRKTIAKYSMNELPPLTPKELAELRQAQAMRDGIVTI